MNDSAGAKNMDLEPLLAMGDLVPSDVEADRVQTILHGLAEVALKVVRGAEASSLTLVAAGGALTTTTCSGALADGMDALQYRLGEGPCLEAARATEWTAILVPDLPADSRWPKVAAAVADATGVSATGAGATGASATGAGAGATSAIGARSVMSVSLFVTPTLGAGGGRQAVGSLNLYASTTDAFGASERDTALLLALYAALALAATEAVNEAGEQIDRLKEAMAHSNVIGQAQGILMERHKFTAGVAFDRLRTASNNLNRKLRDVARDLSQTGEEVVFAPRRRLADVEADRIKAVTRYDILDTPADGAFDRVAAIAARLFGVPMATVSIVDTDRVWFKASLGLGGARQTTRDLGLCASVILDGDSYVVTNARSDPHTVKHPLVTGELGLQFYAAAPIITADGHRLGTVAVMDTEPHEATPEQMQMLTDLASVVMDQLELRLSAMTALRSGRRRG